MGDSCSWILSTSAYKEAIDSEDTECLWIHGEPGKGKTMIAIFLVDIITGKISDSRQDIISYFFCDNTTDKKNTISNALKSILHQILKQSSKNVLLRDFENQGQQMFSSVEAVWLALMRVLKASVFRRVHIVIDGLDECDKESLDIFLDLIATYIEKRPISKCKVKWIFTSRNEVSIRECLKVCCDVDLEANSAEVTRAVGSFIDIKVDELSSRKNYDADLKGWVIQTLREKAEGTFLWVALACSELRKRTVSRVNTRLVLGKLPKSLQSLYARIMEQVLNNEIEEMVDMALEILRAVTIALRPMDLTELAVVSGLPDAVRQSRSDVREYAEQCGSFLTFRDSRVYMVHQSAKEYLLRHQEERLCPYGLITEHEKIAHRCLQYICHDWRKQIVHESSQTVRSRWALRPHVWNRIENLQYPLLHWIEHSNAAASKISNNYTLDVEFFRSNSDLRRNWLDYYKTSQRYASISRLRETSFTALHISAICNTCWVAEQLLDQDRLNYIDCEDFWDMAPLHWAVTCRNTAMVNLLLEKGANPNNKGRFRRKRHMPLADGPRKGTPLGLAVSYNYMEIVRILIQYGAGVNETDYSSMTPLIWSITKNFPSLTALLLQNGANVNLRNPIGKTPLHIAAALGNETIVRQLIQAGAPINARDIEAYSPVHESAYRGHPHVTRLLIAKGASQWDAEEAEKLGLDDRNKAKSDESNMLGTGWSTLRSWGSSQSRTASSKSPTFKLNIVEPGTTVPALRSLGFMTPE
jgi:ankyrin repeat protein